MVLSGPSTKVVDASYSCASLSEVVDGEMSLASCPHVVSQAPQHFQSSEM